MQVFQGTAALELLFSTVGLGWAVNLMELPIISKLVDLLYEFLSANRISLGNALVSHQKGEGREGDGRTGEQRGVTLDRETLWEGTGGVAAATACLVH